MRYQKDSYESVTPGIPMEPLYQEASNLHQVLLSTVILAFFIGCVLLWLGRRGRVMWLTVWSVGLIISSVLYIGAELMGYVR